MYSTPFAHSCQQVLVYFLRIMVVDRESVHLAQRKAPTRQSVQGLHPTAENQTERGIYRLFWVCVCFVSSAARCSSGCFMRIRDCFGTAVWRRRRYAGKSRNSIRKNSAAPETIGAAELCIGGNTNRHCQPADWRKHLNPPGCASV